LDTKERIREIIADQLGCTPSEISDTGDFVVDLGTDPLDSVEITMPIEEEYDIEIPDSDVMSLMNLKSVVDYVNTRLKNK